MLTEVRVPDIGEFDEVEIVEVLVAAGDSVEPEDSLVTLESDKASMDLPAPGAGTDHADVHSGSPPEGSRRSAATVRSSPSRSSTSGSYPSRSRALVRSATLSRTSPGRAS